MPFCDGWEPDTDPPAYLGWYAASLASADPAVVDAATIPVERIAGRVVLVAGGDDQVWPAADFAAAIAARRDAHGLPTSVVTAPDAGHRVLLPGETPVEGGQRMRRGGTVDADRALGERAWPHVVDALGLAAYR
ncbi:acyl-CoA thioester hydrolase/BAAT C-terminal domain-containing protein [Nocardioides antri]|uniref:acyl-CoA thioester hydrolase/BAAT C-terminal domain-containing protein n=1 Tax=Nocardioides antri TaxID=2607659 RepID=UPI00165F3A3C|nr:acyl-CoA thioester hydrolase/BAAT C-terminal domain-containing protein [Nocardioides antri]